MDSSNKKNIARFKIYISSTFGNIIGFIFGKIKKSASSDKSQIEFDKKLVFSLSKSKVPSFKQLTYLNKYLSKGESRVIRILVGVILLSSVYLVYNFYHNHINNFPVYGGVYKEGLVGSLKYINPLYASVNDADNDVASLIFSSLFKRGDDGQIINDLAEKLEVSPDGKKYTVTLRKGVQWQNDDKLSADDVIFTFNAIKDDEYKSPLNESFKGVVIEKLDDIKVAFNLSEPYSGFQELLTFGILPINLWVEIPAKSALLAELNLKPIGSGPYKIKSYSKDKNGNIHSYSLTANKNYYQKVPYIENITFIFYPSFDEAINALNGNEIDGISYLPKELKGQLISQNSLVFHSLEMPQVSAIFFNLNSNKALSDKKTRQALESGISKEAVISSLGEEFYRPVNSPISEYSFAYKKDIKNYPFDKDASAKLLKEAGWTSQVITDEILKAAEQKKDSKDSKEKNTALVTINMGKGTWLKNKNGYFNIKLTTVDRSENTQVVHKIKEYWEQLGVKVNPEIIPVSQIQSSVIKPKNFEALFYGITLGVDPDPYVFWHSSQAEKGLNLSGYESDDADKLLEDARHIVEENKRKELYFKFQDMIAQDVPAIFIYSTKYSYVQSKDIKGFDQRVIYYPSDRFSKIGEWYLKTGKKIVW